MGVAYTADALVVGSWLTVNSSRGELVTCDEYDVTSTLYISDEVAVQFIEL